MELLDLTAAVRLELEGVDAAIEKAERLLEVLRRLKVEAEPGNPVHPSKVVR